ncbi:hypothetical protein D9756_000249 [Leucocoprinus leucothites]|uniref:tripeptidyl-peptidase II n=1 Tax=Leucocoprinus leucothites TaxID=201217 RepID=A0A8H5GE62_9AGAR|nr:hypothetical protein D9756_000249 [Leucoagaricus leucothites]
MKLFNHCLLALAFASGALALPRPEVSYNYRLKESITVPRGWSKVAAAPAEHVIHLRIGLPQSNFAELERHLYEISDPFHSRYGQHLSKAEVEALVTPKEESLDLVDEWLASFGLGEDDFSRSSAKDWVVVKVPISVAEKMLNTKYHVWKYEDTDDHLVRTTEYHLPDHLHGHVELVQPTTLFARWNRMKTTSFFEDDFAKVFGQKGDGSDDVNPSCNKTITVNCLRDLYNFDNYKPRVPEKNAIGISSYLEEYINNQDLQLFYKEQRPEAAGSKYKLITVNGGKNDQNSSLAGSEANLDAQFAFGLTWPTGRVAWTTAGEPPFKPDNRTPTNTNEPYQNWLDAVLAADNLPQTISTSYGEAEQTVPESYANRVCQGIAQLGARGVSMLFSSGDFGVGDGNEDPASNTCLTNDGHNNTRFMPTFPASCPFSTAVGGTEYVPEVAVAFSGGGFSDYFPRPKYQNAVVQEYLGNLPEGTYEGLYNPNGRAFPDVAAMGRRFRIYLEGAPVSIAGTSASAPTFAAVVALLNDVRLSKGQNTLGFLNPWLYSQGMGGFNDITSGNNPGCGTRGFDATEGWDPVTGFGTPDFEKLRNLLPPATYNGTE